MVELEEFNYSLYIVLLKIMIYDWNIAKILQRGQAEWV